MGKGKRPSARRSVQQACKDKVQKKALQLIQEFAACNSLDLVIFKNVHSELKSKGALFPSSQEAAKIQESDNLSPMTKKKIEELKFAVIKFESILNARNRPGQTNSLSKIL